MTAKRFFLFLLTALWALCGAPAAPARAQGMPPESQLRQPGAGNALPAAAAIPMPQPQGAPTLTAGGSPQAGAKAGDPCPKPATALASSPDDMAKVQEEIDRFTLCVQRAQLLERLNESAAKSDSSYDAALGLSAPAVPGLAGAQTNGGLAPLPANALAGADVTPLPGGGGPVPSAAPKTSESVKDAADAPADKDSSKDETPTQSASWTIREISGSATTMQAKLLSPEGDEVRVREGTALPDGKGVVVRITPTEVTVRSGGRAKPLDWAKG